MVRIQLEDRGYLEVKEGTYFPLNFGIGDIRDISKRKGTFSKTITLTGSDNNHNLLNHYYDVNIQSGEFDINQLTRCSVIQDGIVILENAYLQLIEVVKSEKDIRHDSKVEYKVLVKDSVSDFFTLIGNKELTDINLAEYNHVLNASNVAGTFTNDVTDGYKYVLPYIPNNDYVIQNCHPAVYAKVYFDKIFQGAGYTYEWGNLTPSSGTTDDGNFFQKLLIPYNGGEPKVDKDNSRVEATKSSITNSVNASTTAGYNYITQVGYAMETISGTTEIVDNENIYNPTTGVYTTNIELTAPETVTVTADVTYSVQIVNNEASAIEVGTSGFGLTWKPAINVTTSDPTSLTTVLNGISLQTIDPTGTTYASGTTVIQSSTTVSVSVPVTNLANSTDLYINSGMVFANPVNNPIFNPVLTLVSNPSQIADADIEVVISSVNLKVELAGVYGFGDTINMNVYTPQKIKQSEFIKSIFQMYNLYAEVDKSQPNKLILQSRDDFYDSGAEKDWTNKLSKDRDQQIKFLPELTNKRTLLTYKPDTDDPNTVYTRATNDIYGQLRFTYKNEYTRGEDRKELIFSPTPHTVNSFGAVVPMLSVLPQNNIRILIDGGTESCNPYNIWNYLGQYGQAGLTTYPVITHFDDPINPSFDLNFATCDFYFYSELNSKTNNTLFNNYWRRTLGQIDKGKMLTAYFALNESDIQALNLNDKIRINNSWWNINKVIDYNANARGLTKVELISVDEDINLTKYAVNSDTGGEDVDILNFIDVRPIKPIKPTKPFLTFATGQLTKDYNNQVNTKLGHQDITFMGRGNVADGDVKAAIVIGDDKTITQDGIYADTLAGYLEIQLPDGTTWTPSGVLGSTYNLVDAEEDVVLDPFSLSPANFIDAGTDEVIALGSVTSVNEVDANTDQV